jgi:hypothetical protein
LLEIEMGKLGNISGKETAKAFGKAGWRTVGQVAQSPRHDQTRRTGKPFYTST